jgi:hypothetical protein
VGRKPISLFFEEVQKHIQHLHRSLGWSYQSFSVRTHLHGEKPPVLLSHSQHGQFVSLVQLPQLHIAAKHGLSVT